MELRKILPYCTELRWHIHSRTILLAGQPEGNSGSQFSLPFESKNGETTKLTDAVTKQMHGKPSEATYLQSCILLRTLPYRFLAIFNNLLAVSGVQMALDLRQHLCFGQQSHTRNVNAIFHFAPRCVASRMKMLFCHWKNWI